MRAVLVAVFLTALAVPVVAQVSEQNVHRVGPLTVALPSEFASIVPEGVRVIRDEDSELRFSVFRDSTSGRMVTVSANTGLSWWQRFLYKRGYGASDSTPHEYSRVNPRSLPFSDAFGETVGAAFTLASSSYVESAVMVRGCDGGTCYEVTAGGPAIGSESGLQFAGLLSGVTL